MALPTSDNTVNVTRLGSILSTLWGKIKNALGNKSDKTEGVYYVSGTNPYTAYSSSSTYTKWTSGDYTSSNSCTYGGYAYYCSTAISTAEAWNSAHWTKIPTPTWTGTVTGVTELYTGMKIAYKVPIYGGSSSTYLNINNLGNVYVKRNDGNTTTHLQGNTVVILTYDGTYWRWADYDANSTYSGMVTAYVNNAADAAKAATSTNFKLTDGITILITFNVANTKNAALTLNVNNTGAKTLYINDTVSSSANYTIPAGTYFCHYKVPSGASTGNWYLYTNGTFRAIQFKGDLDGDAATASAAKSGSTLETAINGKQNSLGIDSSAGDTTQFLNKKGQWAVPSGTAQVQSDWNQTTTTAVDYIKNKPQNLVQDASYVHTDNNYTTTEKNKLADIASGAEVNVQSDWNQTDTSADDYIKNKPKTVLWLTYGSTYTKAQVDGWIANGYLLCVSYSSRTYKLGRATFYQDTNYYTFSDQLDYVRLTIDNSTSTWLDGTNYPTAASIGAAPSVHSHGNIASDGTDGEATHDTSRFLRGDGAWARLQLRSTLQSEANGYFRITCVAHSDCQHSSVYVFGSYNEYGYLYQVSFRYKNNQFSEAPRVRMITCNNETGLNYIPKAIKYGTGAAGTGYIFIQTNVVQRCTFLVTGNSPSSITIDTVTSTDSATHVSDGVKGHGSVHTEEYGTGTGSSTQPVYVDAGGSIVACSVSDSHYYGGNGVLASVTAYAYVKSGTTLTVYVDNLIEDKTYTAQVVRASSGTASFNIKFQSNSTFSVYGHSQTTTNITTFTLSHSTYPMMFMRSGRNIYIIWY